MADEFLMPKLGLTMESGTIVGWLVEDGAEVRPGQPLLIIETDKVESEVESTGTGLLHHIGEVGQEYLCGAHIGWLLAPGEAPPATSAAPAAAATTNPAPRALAAGAATATGVAVPPQTRAATGAGGRLLASPNARRLAAARGVDLSTVAGSGPDGRITSEDVPDGPPSTNGTTAAPARALATLGVGGRVLASPNARRLAGARGIELSTIAGSGPGGRITSEDVPEHPVLTTEAAAMPTPSQRPSAGRSLATAAARNLADLLGVDIAAVAPTGPDPRVGREDVAAHVRALLARDAPSPTAPGRAPAVLQEPSSIIPMVGMRGTIAKRMSESIQSMAQLTLTMDVDMDAVIADRAARKSAAGDGASVPGYTDYIIAAVAAALVHHPVVNSQIIDDGVALLPGVNVGMAVALDDGLIVPVIHDTPSLGLDDLAAETSRLAAAARSGKLTLPELEGGTFSVTALGMFDVDGFTPIINAPNTAILGVGRLRDDVAWSDDASPVKTSRLTLSLTWDHRAFDGAPAAEFTRSIKANLEAV